ncbi:MAG: ATP-dependent DNA helicase [Acidimicrobiia bacterium]
MDPDGLLRAAVDLLGGEERPGQVDLARAIDETITVGTHLLAEAPTGSGKTLAYLAPVVTSGAKTVIATATIALQDQLWRSDIPLVQRAGGTTRAAVLKGRGQYLCRAKLDAALGGDTLFDARPHAGFDDEIARLDEFAEASTTGDLTEVETHCGPVSNAAVDAVSCAAGECPGASSCHRGDECFAVLARAVAEQADVLVVNHALYCAHLASEGQVLPDHDVVVFDEAHALADIAAGALGADLSPRGLTSLASRLARVGADRVATEAIGKQADTLERLFAEIDGRVVEPGNELSDALSGAAQRIADASASLPKGDASTEAAQAVKLAGARRDTLARLASPAEGDVVWVEGRRAMKVAPVDPGALMAKRLFARRAVVLLSATMGAGERFEPLARRVGLDPDLPCTGGAQPPGLGYRSLRVASPFDYREQGLLYVPRALPEPNDPTWPDAADAEIAALVDAAGGRTLVLCTSNAAVSRIADHLREVSEHSILAQGEGSKRTLIESFVGDETSCLVATRSFWVGIDVPGVSCVLVVIDRIPFARPDDPMVSARRELAQRDGQSPFFAVDLPDAALILAQGSGRLIRSRSDRGVVCVLDRRLATKDYRTVLLRALPPMRRTVSHDDACAFLRDVVTSAPAT